MIGMKKKNRMKTSVFMCMVDGQPGLTKNQLLKLVGRLPEHGYYMPHSTVIDDVALPNAYGFLVYPVITDKIHDEGDIESIDITISKVIGKAIPENRDKLYISDSEHSIFIDREPLTVQKAFRRRLENSKLDTVIIID
jgi:hypothetical protein